MGRPTLGLVTTVLDVAALVCVLAAVVAMCAYFPAAGLPLLAAAVLVGISWAVTTATRRESGDGG